MADGSSWNPYEVHQSADLQTTGEADLRNLTIVATILLSMSMLTFALYLGGIAFNVAMGIGFDPPPGFDQNNIVADRSAGQPITTYCPTNSLGNLYPFTAA